MAVLTWKPKCDAAIITTHIAHHRHRQYHHNQQHHRNTHHLLSDHPPLVHAPFHRSSDGANKLRNLELKRGSGPPTTSTHTSRHQPHLLFVRESIDALLVQTKHALSKCVTLHASQITAHNSTVTRQNSKTRLRFIPAGYQQGCCPFEEVQPRRSHTCSTS